jgi:hypothetical protein
MAVQTHAEPVQKGGSIWVGRPGVKLRAADGKLTTAGKKYEEMVAERGQPRRYEHTDYFHKDAKIEYKNGSQFAEDRHGNMQKTRRWDPTANGGRGGHHFTPAGKRFGHASVRYIVEVPVTAHYDRGDGKIESYKFERSGERITIPVTSDRFERMGMPAGMDVARDVGDHQRQKSSYGRP